MPDAPDTSHAQSTAALKAALTRLSADVAGPLTHALDRLQRIAQTGRLDRASLLALQDDIARAKRAGQQGQAIARLAAGQALVLPEAVPLGPALRQVLDEQAADITMRYRHGHQLTGLDVPVLLDPSLLATLLRATADWAVAHAAAPVHWRLDAPPSPGTAKLVCEVVRSTTNGAQMPQSSAVGAAPGRVTALDNLDWTLMQFAAQAGGVGLDRLDGPAQSLLRLQLPAGPNGIPVGTGRLAAGSQLLVLASNKGMRHLVREALQGQEVFIDSVSTVEEARAYCADGPPQALLFESAFISEALRSLCEHLSARPTRVALIELLPAGHDVEVGRVGGVTVLRLGAASLRRHLAESLVTPPSAAG